MIKFMWLFPVVLAVSTATLWKRNRKSYAVVEYLGI